MPVKVKPAKGGGYDIVNVATGKVEGHSDTIGKAQAAARYRNSDNAKDSGKDPIPKKKKDS